MASHTLLLFHSSPHPPPSGREQNGYREKLHVLHEAPILFLRHAYFRSLSFNKKIPYHTCGTRVVGYFLCCVVNLPHNRTCGEVSLCLNPSSSRELHKTMHASSTGKCLTISDLRNLCGKGLAVGSMYVEDI